MQLKVSTLYTPTALGVQVTYVVSFLAYEVSVILD
jgi:hypothetical protein